MANTIKYKGQLYKRVDGLYDSYHKTQEELMKTFKSAANLLGMRIERDLNMIIPVGNESSSELKDEVKQLRSNRQKIEALLADSLVNLQNIKNLSRASF